ncbi:hypothetical protein [Streptomyces anulatus]|uniref:hypothetical protein n=1 Tax=Streptomyces anulatus TaxID=1892 RepID=UPI0036A668C6
MAPIIAEDIYRQAADAGDADAMVNLGLLLAEAGRTGEAETSLSSVRRLGSETRADCAYAARPDNPAGKVLVTAP